jgi:hypothetical protein
MRALRNPALVALWIVNFAAWWFAITFVWWARIRSPLHDARLHGERFVHAPLSQLRRQNEPPPIAVQLPEGAHCDGIVQRNGAQKRTLVPSAGVTAKPSPPT